VAVTAAPDSPAAARSEAPADAADVRALAWLSGRWVSTSDESTTEEQWSVPAADAMFGVSRTVAGERTVFFEYLRVELDEGGLVYVASPKGRCPPVRFAATEVGEQHVRFENPAHDDPKAIEYRREGDTLVARIEGPGREVSWTYALAAPAATRR
jgi:hypothetical protein